MEIDYTVSLNYGEAEPDEIAEPSPTEDDIVDWIVAGMARGGFTSVDVTCRRQ